VLLPCDRWPRSLRSLADISIVIAGNKYDLEKRRAVKEEDALAYAASVGAAHMYTSAKLNKGLDETFVELATRESPPTATPDRCGGGISHQ